MTLTFQQQVTVFMEALGFVKGVYADYWLLPNTAPLLDISGDHAAFMYRQTLIARRDALKSVRFESEVTFKGAGFIEDRIAAIDQLIKEVRSDEHSTEIHTCGHIRKYSYWFVWFCTGHGVSGEWPQGLPHL